MVVKRWSEIRIWEPRYHDKKVLIATRKVVDRNRVVIERGAYAGEYFVAGAVAKSSPIVSNGKISCYAVDLVQLEPLDE